jgi:hypothetical protein
VTRISPLFPRVGDVVQAPREELMKIAYIKEVRSPMIKNAADELSPGNLAERRRNPASVNGFV